MKFVNKHRTDILAAINRFNIQESEFDFIKRRGRITTHHRETGIEFAYLRKKETRLDPFTGKWQNTEWFKVKSGDSKEQTVRSWDQVVEMFEKWLYMVMNNS